VEDEIAYMRDHPPRCLSGHARPASGDLCAAVQAQLGDDGTVFSPVCECSNEALVVQSSERLGPFNVRCPKCSATRTIFDPTQHGYDGELGHNTGSEMTTPQERPCSKCGNSTFQVAVGFQFCGETDVLEEEDAPDVNPEDLFGWVIVMARCEECGVIQEIGQVECA